MFCWDGELTISDDTEGRYVYNVKLVKIHDNIKITFTILKSKIT